MALSAVYAVRSEGCQPNRTHFTYGADQFNDKPEGGGDGSALRLSAKNAETPLFLQVVSRLKSHKLNVQTLAFGQLELLGNFLPRMSKRGRLPACR